MARCNDLAFVRDAMARLRDAGITTWLFGGWAEELRGMAPPRPHHDVDLLYPATGFARVDAFLAGGTAVTEIAAKRLPHKRAFLDEGIMVELILVQPFAAGGHVTPFWGSTRYRWPGDVFAAGVGGLRVASAVALREYRLSHGRLHASRTGQLPAAPGITR